MFKNVIKSAAFAAGFLIILISLTYVIRTNGDVKDRFTGFYAEKKDSIDVIMIGSSPVYPYYATPKMYGEYGLCAYPLSSNLQRPVASTYLIEEAEKTQSPKLYVFEMRMYTAREMDLTNNMAYTRGVTDNLKYSPNRIKLINAMVDDDKDGARYTYYFDIFKYHSNWKTMVMPSQLVCFRYSHPDDQKGYVMTDEVGPCEALVTSDLTEVMPMPAEQEKHLYELLDYLKEHNMQALFILSPTTMEVDKQKMYNYMTPIIESYGYTFLNLNDYYDEIGIDFATDFSDYGGHTNAIGADKCTDFLSEYIRTHYELPDRRLEPDRYASWEQAYEQWKGEYEEAVGTIKDHISKGEFAPPASEE